MWKGLKLEGSQKLTRSPVFLRVKLAGGLTDGLLDAVQWTELRCLADKLVESLAIATALPAGLAAGRPL